ncbi:SGNH/GDSL hydrolase family protein [Ovoidimarina sediminis]|uniref:SGNH/GDSL hydrolase family protein n=1 Tax=Ovoidimarina sediminis TaxID=3079856 RepID=UPI00290BB13A|nr:SGNH/GDSL hydrolase family protein [Rhodophyticola sp. MJ-SS7]MDU8943542.1 SGNH/GDSL hydrolase family protein [Rhodophyticola sp. MJ-SS7]
MSDDVTAERFAYFGDSYSDTGRIYSLTGDVLWLPYPFDILGYQQSFSNGDIWTEILSDTLGVDDANYAVGGAEAAGTQPLLEYLALRQLTGLLAVAPEDPSLSYDINLGAQVDRFLADAGGADLSSTAGWIFAGLNDYLNFILTSENPGPAEGQALVTTVVSSIGAEIERLAEAGIAKIYITNLPSAGFIPFTANAPAPIRGLAEFGVELHNALLQSLIASQQAAGLDVELIDLQVLSDEITADPTAFGFVAPLGAFKVVGFDDAMNPVFNPAVDGFDEDQFAFWDVVHPTEAGHGVIAAYQGAVVTHETINGQDGADMLRGTSGADLILASGGNDLCLGRNGDDTILAGLGNDRTVGGAGDDLVLSGSGNDIALGGAGHDVLAGNDGNDVLRGGTGNDLIVGGLGSDRSFGGAGDDAFVFIDPALTGDGTGAYHDLVAGGGGVDTLYLALGNAARDTVNAALDLGAYFADALVEIGIEIRSVETVVLLDDRSDLAEIESYARIDDADLWGIL